MGSKPSLFVRFLTGKTNVPNFFKCAEINVSV